MKRIFIAFIFSLTSLFVFSQTKVTFWTNDNSACPIKVYVNGSYLGNITRAYGSAPSCGASGCVTAHPSTGNVDYEAIGTDGRRWDGRVNTTGHECNTVCCQGESKQAGPVSVVFWTDDESACPITISINGRNVGQITHARSSTPDCGASGCLTTTMNQGGNTVRATGQNGRWEGPNSSLNYSYDCHAIKLSKSNKITNTNTSGNSSSYGGYEPTPYDGGGLSDAMTRAAEAVVTLVIALSSDFYITGAFSGNYGGFEFGLRNSWNKYIDVEYGFSYYKLGAWGKSENAFGSDFYGKSVPRTYWGYSGYSGAYSGTSFDDAPVHLWGLNLNFLFNFIERPYVNGGYVYGGIRSRWSDLGRRNPVANPFIGICTHYFFGLSNPNDNWGSSSPSFNDKMSFAMGPCAGVHLAAGDRVKFSIKYTFLYNFERERIAAHHVEAGFILKYQLTPFWE